MFRNILVAVDGSPAAHKAVDIAGALASQYGARLSLLQVRPSSDKSQSHGVIPFPGREILAREAKYLEHRGLAAPDQHVECGAPAPIILEFTKSRGIDLIVVGTRCRGRLDELLSDSIEHAVAEVAHCACLTVYDPSTAATSRDFGILQNGGSS